MAWGDLLHEHVQLDRERVAFDRRAVPAGARHLGTEQIVLLQRHEEFDGSTTSSSPRLRMHCPGAPGHPPGKSPWCMLLPVRAKLNRRLLG